MIFDKVGIRVPFSKQIQVSKPGVAMAVVCIGSSHNSIKLAEYRSNATIEQTNYKM